MITESTAVRTAKVVNEKEAMDDLLTADEFADRPREGFIHRSPDPTDGRRQLISLTDAGVAQAEDTIGAREEWLARVLQDGLTEDERRVVRHAMALLDRIA
jgi:DNA-binding MarR family transcriptional regulator